LLLEQTRKRDKDLVLIHPSQAKTSRGPLSFRKQFQVCLSAVVRSSQARTQSRATNVSAIRRLQFSFWNSASFASVNGRWTTNAAR